MPPKNVSKGEKTRFQPPRKVAKKEKISPSPPRSSIKLRSSRQELKERAETSAAKSGTGDVAKSRSAGIHHSSDDGKARSSSRGRPSRKTPATRRKVNGNSRPRARSQGKKKGSESSDPDYRSDDSRVVSWSRSKKKVGVNKPNGNSSANVRSQERRTRSTSGRPDYGSGFSIDDEFQPVRSSRNNVRDSKRSRSCQPRSPSPVGPLRIKSEHVPAERDTSPHNDPQQEQEDNDTRFVYDRKMMDLVKSRAPPPIEFNLRDEIKKISNKIRAEERIAKPKQEERPVQKSTGTAKKGGVYSRYDDFLKPTPPIQTVRPLRRPTSAPDAKTNVLKASGVPGIISAAASLPVQASEIVCSSQDLLGSSSYKEVQPSALNIEHMQQISTAPFSNPINFANSQGSVFGIAEPHRANKGWTTTRDSRPNNFIDKTSMSKMSSSDRNYDDRVYVQSLRSSEDGISLQRPAATADNQYNMRDSLSYPDQRRDASSNNWNRNDAYRDSRNLRCSEADDGQQGSYSGAKRIPVSERSQQIYSGNDYYNRGEFSHSTEGNRLRGSGFNRELGAIHRPAIESWPVSNVTERLSGSSLAPTAVVRGYSNYMEPSAARGFPTPTSSHSRIQSRAATVDDTPWYSDHEDDC